MKKKVVYGVLLVVLFVGAYIGWMVFGPTVSAPEGKYFYITTGSSYEDVRQSLLDQKIISGSFFFDRLAKQIKYNKAIKPGRYQVKNGMSLYNLVRMLRSGR